MKYFYLLLLLLAVNFSAAQEAPSVEVKTLSGRKVQFSDLIQSDTIYVVSFWATWCTPCIKELREIDEIYPTLRDSFRMKLIAVNIDDSRNTFKVLPNVLGEGWSYEVVLDQNQDLARAMNVNAVPMLFITNRKKEIVYSHQGYTPGGINFLIEELEKINSETK